MIRALMASVADTVMFPMQDLLGLGGAARMNQPGRMQGNWRWRYESGQVRPELAKAAAQLRIVQSGAPSQQGQSRWRDEFRGEGVADGL